MSETHYVRAGSTTLKLKRGTYKVYVVASPILADGSLYTVPARPAVIKVAGGASSSSASDSAVSPTSPSNVGDSDSGGSGSCRLSLSPVTDATTVTDDMIKKAQEAAGKDPDDNGRAEQLAQTATKKRDDAVQKKQEEERKAEEQKKRDQAVSEAKAEGYCVYPGVVHIDYPVTDSIAAMGMDSSGMDPDLLSGVNDVVLLDDAPKITAHYSADTFLPGIGPDTEPAPVLDVTDISGFSAYDNRHVMVAFKATYWAEEFPKVGLVADDAKVLYEL